MATGYELSLDRWSRGRERSRLLPCLLCNLKRKTVKDVTPNTFLWSPNYNSGHSIVACGSCTPHYLPTAHTLSSLSRYYTRIRNSLLYHGASSVICFPHQQSMRLLTLHRRCRNYPIKEFQFRLSRLSLMNQFHYKQLPRLTPAMLCSWTLWRSKCSKSLWDEYLHPMKANTLLKREFIWID